MDKPFNVKIGVDKDILKKFNSECNQIKIKIIKDTIKNAINMGYIDIDKYDEIEKTLIDKLVLQK